MAGRSRRSLSSGVSQGSRCMRGCGAMRTLGWWVWSLVRGVRSRVRTRCLGRSRPGSWRCGGRILGGVRGGSLYELQRAGGPDGPGELVPSRSAMTCNRFSGRFRCGDHAAGLAVVVKAFELDWGQVVEAGVASDGVVEGFDPLEHRRGQLGPGGPVAAVEELDLHRAPERLHERVVVGAGDLAHRADQAGLAQPVAEEPGRVLGAAVGVHDRSDRVGGAAGPSRRASTTSSVRRWSAIDQPTTRRLNTSRTAAQ